MAGRPALQSADSSFDDPLTVKPWRVFVDNLCQNLDPYVYKQLLFFSKDQLKDSDYQKFSDFSDPENYFDYFSTLEDCLGESGAVEHLEHSISLTKFHGGFGEVNYREWIKDYKDAKVQYLTRCAEKGISLDPNFVGRELLLEDVVKYMKKDYKGVVLCGLSGMGKTCLANQVCSRLMYCKPRWNVIIINEREKTDLNEFLLDLIYGLSDELCVDDQMQFKPDTDIKSLKLQCHGLMAELVEKQENVVIFLDNVDGHCETPDKQHEFCQSLREILSKIGANSNVKLLITVGKKLSNTTQSANQRNTILNGQMIEQELKPLTAADSAKVLRKLSHKSEKELIDSVCNDIHSLCGGIPFPISMAGNLIKNGYQAEALLSGLHSQPPILAMDNFLQKSFQMMEESSPLHDLKILLVRLSVFQTASFNIQAAVSVGNETKSDEKFRRSNPISSGMSYKDPSVKDLMWIKLQHLKTHFLLEVDDALSSLGRKKKSVEKLYSLHPLVVTYLSSLCGTEQTLGAERERAKEQFLKYFCAEIEKFGEKSDKDPLIARHVMEANMVHIKEFFKIIRKAKLLLSNYLPQKDLSKHKASASKAVQRRRIWKIAELTISINEKKLFARRQAEIEKDAKNLYSYIFWRALEAEGHLAQDRIELAQQVLDNVASELGIVTDDIVCSKAEEWDKTLDEKIPSWATFYKVIGRLYYMKSRNNNEKNMQGRTLQLLKVAENLFEGKSECDARNCYSRKYYQTDLADVKNLQGCVYFLMKNYDRSIQCHKEAYTVILKLTGNQLHRSLTEYQTNMAACVHQKALDTNDEVERSRLFYDALKLYDQSISSNKRMKCEMMPSQAGTLRNRAEIYYRQEQLDKALTDGKAVLKIIRNLHSPPHIEITMALERVAHYHLKIGKKKQKEMDAEGQEHLEKAMKFYDETLMHIQNGGLPIENNDARTYRHVRDNHVKAMKLLRYETRLIDDRIKQYQAFEEGKYNKSIQRNLQHDLDFIPEEFLKEAIEKGLKFIPHRMDESDSESSETSSSETSERSTSNSSSSKSDNPQQMIEVEEVLTRRRRDSGLEELEMSGDEITDTIAHVDESDTGNTEVSKHDFNESNTSMNVTCSEEEEGDAMTVTRHGSEYKKHDYRKNSSSSLTRQANLDFPDLMERDERDNCAYIQDVGQHNLDIDSLRQLPKNVSKEAWRGSQLSSSLEAQRVRDTSSSGDSDITTQKRRETWSSAGSRDSVFSQMGHTLDFIELGENSDGDVEAPVGKRKRTDESNVDD